jgi:hypothetical protein
MPPASPVIREHLASKGLGLHCDLQNEHMIVGNNAAAPRVYPGAQHGKRRQVAAEGTVRRSV